MLKPARRVGKKFQAPVPTTVGGSSLIFKILPLYLKNKEERFPRTPVGPFRTDTSLYKQPPDSGLRVTWFGHSSSLIEIDGVRILIDPIWDQRASPMQWSGPKRFFPPTLPLDQLPKIDAVLLSHDHYDHLGEGTVRRLGSLPSFAHTEWITSLEVGEILRGFGIAAGRITELNWTESVTVANGACRITSVPSRHFSGRSLFNRFETLWASFVIEGSLHKVYYGADSGWWEGFTEIGEQYGPFDFTMLEIGAFNELWHQIHLGPEGAARAYEDLGGPQRAGILMPIHWGLFDLALHAWDQPITRLLEIAHERQWPVFSPEPGLPTEVSDLRSGWWRRGRS